MNINEAKLTRFFLFLAAIYNIIWGTIISLKPDLLLYGQAPTDYNLILIKCIGMFVAVYGIAYYFASTDPVRYWPLITAGLIGKILGPLGSIFYIFLKKLPYEFFNVNIINDIIWIGPFAWILYKVFIYNKLIEKEVFESSLYERFLGIDFQKMSPLLQKFHASKTKIKVTGEFSVERGNNWFPKLMADMSDLPKASLKEKVNLIVEPNKQKETWFRTIGSKTIISEQWLDGKFLVEKFKFVRIYLKYKIENESLEIYDSHTTVLGIAMPPFFTPRVVASGIEDNNKININVDIWFFPLGRIIKYSGTVEMVFDKY